MSTGVCPGPFRAKRLPGERVERGSESLPIRIGNKKKNPRPLCNRKGCLRKKKRGSNQGREKRSLSVDRAKKGDLRGGGAIGQLEGRAGVYESPVHEERANHGECFPSEDNQEGGRGESPV